MQFRQDVFRQYEVSATPQTQHDLEQLATSIIKIMSATALNTVRDLDRKERVRDLALFFTTTGDSASSGYAKPKEASVAKFLRGFHLTYRVREAKDATTRGQYDKGRHQIDLFHPRYEKLEALWDSYHGYAKVTREDLYKFLEEVESTLVHELTHAYDDYQSKGKALKESSDEIIKRGGTDAYLKTNPEVNARFAQAVKAIRKKKMLPDYHPRGGWKEYLGDFMYVFTGWDPLSDQQKQRLVHRLSLEYKTLTPAEHEEMLTTELLGNLWAFAYKGTLDKMKTFDYRLGKVDWKAELKKRLNLDSFKEAVRTVKELERHDELVKTLGIKE